MLRYCVMFSDTLGIPIGNDLRWLLRRGSPLPIPNRVVKPACADGTAICGRVCRRLSLLNPNLYRLGFFFYIQTKCLAFGLGSSFFSGIIQKLLKASSFDEAFFAFKSMFCLKITYN